jgi:DNA processing protein
MEDEKLYQVALNLIPKIGDVNSKILISYCGSAKAIFQAKKAQLLKIPNIGAKIADAITNQQVLAEAEKTIATCDRQSIRILHFTDKTYPARLKQIADSPNILYVKGNGEIDPERTVAIVGTRNATTYGKDMSTKIAKSCHDLNATIISGLAYGVDIYAHRTGVSQKTPNMAVLAGGLDQIYPAAHKKTSEEILENGLLISENPPGTQAQAHFFPARNRIIAGLSDAVVVVEAAIKGGALITANIADSYDKPVFAVPGDLEHKYSEGCNYLIRNQKAYIYTGPEDLRYHLNWDLDDNQPKKASTPKIPDNLSPEEEMICSVLIKTPTGVPIDDLAWKCQISINKLASLLLTLEFQGTIKSLPGKKYQLV